MPEQNNSTVRYIPGAVIYLLEDDFDVESADMNTQQYLEEISKGNHIVFDVGRVAFMNSRFVEALISLSRKAAEQDLSVTLLAPRQNVYDALYAMGLFKHKHLNAFLSMESLQQYLEGPHEKK